MWCHGNCAATPAHVARIQWSAAKRNSDEAAQPQGCCRRCRSDPNRLHTNEWWIELRLLSRKMLDVGEHRTASSDCAGRSTSVAGDTYKTEQEFTAGWIALRF
jgi:soluble lytic murein transglycosylase